MINSKAKGWYFEKHRKRDLRLLLPLIMLLCILACQHKPLISKVPPPPSAKRIFAHPQEGPVLCPTEVIFDLSKEQVFSPWDTGFMGYSGLSIMLLKLGFWVSSNNHSLLELLEGISEDTIIVFGVAKGHSVFTEEELSGSRVAMLFELPRGGQSRRWSARALTKLVVGQDFAGTRQTARFFPRTRGSVNKERIRRGQRLGSTAAAQTVARQQLGPTAIGWTDSANPAE